MTRRLIPVLLLAAGLSAAVALGRAGSTPAQVVLPIAPPPKAADGDDEPKARKGRVLTAESLSEMLDSMGYDFRSDTTAAGNTIYTLTIPSDTWKFVVEVSVSPNGSFVWLVAPLHTLPAAVPSEPLVRLMQENWAVYPHTFAVPKDSRRLYLQRALENQNVTPAKLRGAIEAMTGTIRSTAPLWDVPKWGQTSAADGKKGSDGAATAYPDTADGLTKFCKEIVAAAKTGKRSEVAAKVKGLALPDPDAWFKRVFGPDAGAALAEEYAATLPQFEATLTRVFMTVAEEGQTEVEVLRFTRPDPENATGNQNKAMEAMVVKTPLYSVYFNHPGEDTGMHLYSFVYADGGVRLVGKMKAVVVRTSAFRGLNGFDFLAPPNGERPEVNPLVPSFNTPLAPSAPLRFRPVDPVDGVNELDPARFRHLAPLLAPGATALSPLAGQMQIPPKKKKPLPEDDEPSIVGTWKGDVSLGGTKWKVTTTYRANGTYRSIMEYLDHIIASKGTYTYADGVLTTEPEDGIPTTFTITFVDDDTVRAKGGGFTITYRRQ